MSNWNTYYTGTLVDINLAIVQINHNCGFPDGYTETWANPTQNYTDHSTYFFQMPPPEGYTTPLNSWTQEQMINGVVNVNQEQSQSNWFPPFPPGDKA